MISEISQQTSAVSHVHVPQIADSKYGNLLGSERVKNNVNQCGRLIFVFWTDKVDYTVATGLLFIKWADKTANISLQFHLVPAHI